MSKCFSTHSNWRHEYVHYFAEQGHRYPQVVRSGCSRQADGQDRSARCDLLRGKLKTDYTPHVDCGDFVIIINAEQAVLTGKKLEQKYYRTHSGYPGGLHETQYKKLMKDKPELAMRLAVRGMLQKNTIAQWQLKRLKIYRGAEHPHAAQKPEVWDR